MLPSKISRAVAVVACVTAASCEAITGSGRPSFFLALSVDSLPVFEEASVVAVNAAGDTIQARVDEWTASPGGLATLSAPASASEQNGYVPAARVVGREVGSTTISAEINGDRATARLVVVPPLIPERPMVSATYFSRNHRFWVQWGPLNRARFFRVFRRQVDESEWTLLAEGIFSDYTDALLPGTDPTKLRYAVEICNESGCSDRGEAAAP